MMMTSRAVKTIENGSYWAVGVSWQPSRFYSLEALTGNNLTTCYRGSVPNPAYSTACQLPKTGKLAPNPGEVWSGDFQHSTRRTSWNARYEEETTTQQEQQLEDGICVSLD